ncbi:hypothetical protein [Bacillus kwashiorkori]|uniref:hypothetical protein n=1 Tax=Bacillus kwashiorkori TaxID=1522318 RepID=UPI0007864FDC|nr:hypothetical protein [Bacillus kwashiorkori]
MITDLDHAITTIKAAEENAQQLIIKAKEKEQEIVEEAHLLAKKQYADIIESAYKEAQVLKQSAKIEGEAEAKKLKELGYESLVSLKQISEEQINEAVMMIMERITNGNRSNE